MYIYKCEFRTALLSIQANTRTRARTRTAKYNLPVTSTYADTKYIQIQNLIHKRGKEKKIARQ